MKFLDELESMVFTKLNNVKTIASIFRLETKLAALSVYPFLLNALMILVVLFTLWLTAMGLIAELFFQLYHNIFFSLSMTLLLNIIFLIALLKYLSFNLKNMSFANTRACLTSDPTQIAKTFPKKAEI